jgi:hypothetical protein
MVAASTIDKATEKMPATSTIEKNAPSIIIQDSHTTKFQLQVP